MLVGWRPTTARRVENATAIDPKLVLFYHFRKMGGTSVRDAFERDGRYQAISYCLDEPTAMHQTIEAMKRTKGRVFWEKHCAPNLPGASRTIRELRRRFGARRVFAFATLRHPYAVVASEFNYFHRSLLPFEDFVSLNSELVLFGTRTCDPFPFFGMQSARGRGSCEDLCVRTEQAFEAFDAVLFVETVAEWSSRLPPGILRVPIPSSNQRVYAARNASWVARHNECSARAYDRLRRRFDSAKPSVI